MQWLELLKDLPTCEIPKTYQQWYSHNGPKCKLAFDLEQVMYEVKVRDGLQ